MDTLKEEERLDESGQDPAGYARWLKTLSDELFYQELNERQHDWNTCPAEQDDYNYEVRYDACCEENARRTDALWRHEPGYVTSDSDDDSQDDESEYDGMECPGCGYPLNSSGECTGNSCGLDIPT